MKISKEKFNTYKKEIKKCMAICCNCHQMIHTKTEKIKSQNWYILTPCRGAGYPAPAWLMHIFALLNCHYV